MSSETEKLQQQADQLELEIRQRCRQLKEIWQSMAEQEQRQRLLKEQP